MGLMGKDKNASEKLRDDMNEAAAISEAPPAPTELMKALEGIQQEWDIFQTRVKVLFDNLQSDAAKVTKKKSLSHAKHAAMCVRDALKELGRVTL